MFKNTISENEVTRKRENRFEPKFLRLKEHCITYLPDYNSYNHLVDKLYFVCSTPDCGTKMFLCQSCFHLHQKCHPDENAAFCPKCKTLYYEKWDNDGTRNYIKANYNSALNCVCKKPKYSWDKWWSKPACFNCGNLKCSEECAIIEICTCQCGRIYTSHEGIHYELIVGEKHSAYNSLRIETNF